MRILADIGGTNARFAIEQNGAPGETAQVPAAQFPALEDALEEFCEKKNIKPGGSLAIATAAFDDGGTWRFVNQNKWVIEPAKLKNAGWNTEIIINDYAAAAWGVRSLTSADMDVLKDGAQNNLPRCVMGPGTGLGLGYLGAAGAQLTHGAQAPAAALNDEQFGIIKKIKAIKNNDTIVTYENVASGSGLHLIYRALAPKGSYKSAREMLEHADDADVKTSLKYFHEFLGLAAGSAVEIAHAYGGLYLIGSLVRALREKDLFDFAAFEKHFCVKSVESATRDLGRTKIAIVTRPHLALYGLLEALRQ